MSPKDQLDHLIRGAAEVISKDEFLKKITKALAENRPLRVKAGFDPSAPDIHLGHTVLLYKLRQFQDLGHKVIFIIGDFTAVIGDPTGRSQTRPMINPDELERNAATYEGQARKILKYDPATIEVVRNSVWLDAFSLAEFSRVIASRYTVARLLERDDFEKRMAGDQPISVREFLYPLYQGYDSVKVKADIEIGGTDQKFNLLVGRDLQRAFQEPEQVVMTLPLLVGLDGKSKMSKSLGNHIGVTDAPEDMYGKLMSLSDELMYSYYTLLTDVSGDDVRRDVESGREHPKKAKEKLAKIITARFSGTVEADKAAAEFEKIFSRRENPADAPLIQFPRGRYKISRIIQDCRCADSSNEAKRLVVQKAVSVDGQVVSDPEHLVDVDTREKLLKVGKRRFARFAASEA